MIVNFIDTLTFKTFCSVGYVTDIHGQSAYPPTLCFIDRNDKLVANKVARQSTDETAQLRERNKRQNKKKQTKNKRQIRNKNNKFI